MNLGSEKEQPFSTVAKLQLSTPGCFIDENRVLGPSLTLDFSDQKSTPRLVTTKVLPVHVQGKFERGLRL